jgi:hypothetical protein
MNSIEADNKRFAAIRACIPPNTVAFRVVHYVPFCWLLDGRSPKAVANDIMQNIGFWEWIVKTKPDRKTDINTLRDVYTAFDAEDK